MPDISTAVYVGPEGTYFDVLGPLPDAPAGSVILNVSGFLFGLRPEHIAEFLTVLASNGEYMEMMHLVETDDGQDPLLAAYTERDGSTVVRVAFAWPNDQEHRVVIPAEMSAVVRARIEGAARGE